MVDTIQITIKLPKWKCKKIRESINNHATKNDKMESKFRPSEYNNNRFVTNIFHGLGLKEIALVSNTDIKYYGLEIEIRPKLLIDANNYIDPTYFHEFIEVNKKFNNLMNDILKLDLPEFFYWTCKRIDYAIDLTIDEELIPLYIKFIKRGYIPKNMLINNITKQHFDSELNAYFVSTIATINIYDRFSTLSKKSQENHKEYINIEKAREKLRFECQCKIEKTNNIKDQYGFTDKKVMHFLNFKICKNVILYYLDLVIGNGRYLKIDSARKIINDSNLKERRKLRLIYVLDHIGKTGGIWAYREVKCKDKDEAHKIKKEFNKVLSEIRNLGINPAIIPKSLEINELEGLDKKIKEYFDYWESKYKE